MEGIWADFEENLVKSTIKVNETIRYAKYLGYDELAEKMQAAI